MEYADGSSCCSSALSAAAAAVGAASEGPPCFGSGCWGAVGVRALPQSVTEVWCYCSLAWQPLPGLLVPAGGQEEALRPDGSTCWGVHQPLVYSCRPPPWESPCWADQTSAVASGHWG